jgi:hypothetical protein
MDRPRRRRTAAAAAPPADDAALAGTGAAASPVTAAEGAAGAAAQAAPAAHHAHGADAQVAAADAPPDGPPALELRGVPQDVVARILRLLPLLDRVRAEGTCRGWLAFLRAPEQYADLDTDAVVRACVAEGLLPQSEHTGRPAPPDAPRRPAAWPVALLAARAGCGLRSLHVTGCAHATALWLALQRGQPELASLRFSGVSAARVDAALEALTAGGRALPAAVRARCGELDHDLQGPPRDELLRRLLARAVPDGALELQLGGSVALQDELAQLAQQVRACGWREACLALRTPPAPEPLAQTLRPFLSDAAVPEAATVVLRVESRPVTPHELQRTVQALPPRVLLHLAGRVRCETAADVALLPTALQPGAVVGADLSLRRSALATPAALSTALAALRACADAAGERGSFALCMHGLVCADSEAQLAALLRADVLQGLWLHIRAPDQLEGLAPALGPRLRTLALAGACMSTAGILAVADVLQRGHLPALEALMFEHRPLDAHAALALSLALEHRTAPLTLGVTVLPSVAGVRALCALLLHAHPRSGVPLQAASQLLALLLDLSAETRAAGAQAIRECASVIAAPLLRLLAEPSLLTEPDSAMAGGGAFATVGALLALLYPVSHMFRAELLRTPSVLLLASLARRARWRCPPRAEQCCTSLLHRVLLDWPRHLERNGGVESVQAALGGIATACRRGDLGAAADAADEHAIYVPQRIAADEDSIMRTEREEAEMALLLTCSLAGEATPGVAADVAWLASRAVWLFESILQRALAGHADAKRVECSLFAAAQHYAAAVRIPAVLRAFCAAPEFPDIMRRLLCVQWATAAPQAADARAQEDAQAVYYLVGSSPLRRSAFVAELAQGDAEQEAFPRFDLAAAAAGHQQAARTTAAAHGAAAAIFAHLGACGVRLLPAAWASAANGSRSAELVIASVLSGQLRNLHTRWASAATGAQEAAEAAAHVSNILAALQEVPAQVALFDVLTLHALAVHMRESRAADGAGAAWCLPLLHAGLLHWARGALHGQGGPAPAAALLDALAAACERRAAPAQHDTSAWAQCCRREALCLLLICSLAPGDAPAGCTHLLSAHAWLAANAAWLFGALAEISYFERCVPAHSPAWLLSPLQGGGQDVALHLAVALRLAPLAHAFTWAPGFAAGMTALLAASWLLRCARDPMGTASAATAYAALASFLQQLDGDARRRLAGGWVELSARRHGGSAAPNAAAHNALWHLSRELAAVCGLLAHDAAAGVRAAAEPAVAQLMRVLNQVQALTQDDGAGPADA